MKMSGRLARYVYQWLRTKKLVQKNICVLGATFKENVPDLRNSQTSGSRGESFGDMAQTLLLLILMQPYLRKVIQSEMGPPCCH